MCVCVFICVSGTLFAARLILLLQNLAHTHTDKPLLATINLLLVVVVFVCLTACIFVGSFIVDYSVGFSIAPSTMLCVCVCVFECFGVKVFVPIFSGMA